MSFFNKNKRNLSVYRIGESPKFLYIQTKVF